MTTLTDGTLQHVPGSHVRVNGANLWIEQEGRGEPLLLIAGGPGASHTYLHGHSPLSKQSRLIFFDAVGTGRSDRAHTPAEYTLDRAISDIEGIRAVLGISQWNVLGHSYGGIVAQAYALEHPESVSRLILANTPISGEAWQAALDYVNEQVRHQHPEAWERVQKVRALGLRSHHPEHQQAYAVPPSMLYFYDGSNASKTVFEISSEVYHAMGGEDANFCLGPVLANIDFRQRLKELRMPTLVLAGRFDRVVSPKFTLQFKTFAPQVEFVMFEKSGHLPFVEEPDETFEVINSFLRR